MSLVANTKRLVLLLCFLLSSLSERALGVIVADDPTWNYDQNGKDWNFENCNSKTSTNVQSPYELSTTAGQFFAWNSFCDVSFLPGWKVANIDKSNYGVSNYVLRINATDGNLGSFYATEPFPQAAQVKWEALQVRFHYPSEHTIDGVQFALEMQITLDDTQKLCSYCTSHLGAFSVFFEVSDDDAESDFWSWTNEMTAGTNLTSFDLNNIFDKNTAIQSQMWGYRGSDSEPSCTENFCWYFNYPVQKISQTTLDKLKVPNVTFNNRALNLNGRPIYRLQQDGLLYKPTTSSDEL